VSFYGAIISVEETVRGFDLVYYGIKFNVEG
jgi:hypothetical protein